MMPALLGGSKLSRLRALYGFGVLESAQGIKTFGVYGSRGSSRIPDSSFLVPVGGYQRGFYREFRLPEPNFLYARCLRMFVVCCRDPNNQTRV